MVVNHLRVLVASVVITAVLLLLWQIDVLSTQKAHAMQRVGELEQNNQQLVQDLASERNALETLRLSYEDEQGKIAQLLDDLEQTKHQSLHRQKVIYEKAINTDCGAQPLPDDIIRMRADTAATPTG